MTEHQKHQILENARDAAALLRAIIERVEAMPTEAQPDPPVAPVAPRGKRFEAAFEAARRIIGETEDPVAVQWLAEQIMGACGCKQTYAYDAIRNICYAGHAIMLGTGRGATVMKTEKTKENNQ